MHSFNLYQSEEPSREEQHVETATQALRIVSDYFGTDYEDFIDRLHGDFQRYQDEQSVLQHPLTGEQLRTADGVCPRHQVELEIAEYGNPDADMVCPQCEVEIKEAV